MVKKDKKPKTPKKPVAKKKQPVNKEVARLRAMTAKQRALNQYKNELAKAPTMSVPVFDAPYGRQPSQQHINEIQQRTFPKNLPNKVPLIVPTPGGVSGPAMEAMKLRIEQKDAEKERIKQQTELVTTTQLEQQKLQSEIALIRQQQQQQQQQFQTQQQAQQQIQMQMQTQQQSQQQAQSQTQQVNINIPELVNSLMAEKQQKEEEKQTIMQQIAVAPDDEAKAKLEDELKQVNEEETEIDKELVQVTNRALPTTFNAIEKEIATDPKKFRVEFAPFLERYKSTSARMSVGEFKKLYHNMYNLYTFANRKAVPKAERAEAKRLFDSYPHSAGLPVVASTSKKVKEWQTQATKLNDELMEKYDKLEGAGLKRGGAGFNVFGSPFQSGADMFFNLGRGDSWGSGMKRRMDNVVDIYTHPDRVKRINQMIALNKKGGGFSDILNRERKLGYEIFHHYRGGRRGVDMPQSENLEAPPVEAIPAKMDEAIPAKMDEDEEWKNRPVEDITDYELKKPKLEEYKPFRKEVFSEELPAFAPPEIRNLVDKWGDATIIKARMCRVPLSGVIQKLGNLITMGKLEQQRKKLGYENLFHLYVELALKKPDGEVGVFLLEKNQKAEYKVTKGGLRADAQCINQPPTKPVTLLEALKRAEKRLGADKLWVYNLSGCNCQDFAVGILGSGNGMLTREGQKFAMQSPDKLIPPLLVSGVKKVTDLANKLKSYFYGKGLPSVRGGMEIFPIPSDPADLLAQPTTKGGKTLTQDVMKALPWFG